MLKRLVPTDNSHTFLQENEWVDIEVIPENSITFQAKVGKRFCPAKVYIRYNDKIAFERELLRK